MFVFELELFVKLLQENVYCEIVLCQCVNDVVCVVMFVYVVGIDFDYFVVLFGICCLMILFVDLVYDFVVVMESDVDLCVCIQFVLQSFLVVGFEGVYVLYVCNVDGCVFDVLVVSLVLCEVFVMVFVCDGDGMVVLVLIDVVVVVLQVDDVWLFIDKVIVCGVEILCYQVCVWLVFFVGLDCVVVFVQVNWVMKQYIDFMYCFGMEVMFDGIYVVVCVVGVQKVIFESLFVGLLVMKQQVFYCIGIELIDGGVYSNE